MLEVLSQIAVVGLFLAALLTVFAARKQIAATISQNRASIVLELDRRWESDEMIASRTLMSQLWSDVRKKEAPENYDAVFKRRLDAMQNDDPTQYREILRLAGFFETSGWMIGEKYLKFEEFNDLFGVSLRMFGDVFQKHLEGRRHKEKAPRYYNHALSLVQEIKT